MFCEGRSKRNQVTGAGLNTASWLKLKPGQDSIHYEILPGGQVFMCRLGDEQEDHTMNAFLRFLDADIQNNPQKTRPFNIQQGKKLVAGIDVNIDDEIGDDE